MGTIDHLTYLKDFLEEHQELSTTLRVVFGDSEQKLVVGKGHFCLIMTNDHDIQITYVYYVPRVAKHLTLIGQITDNRPWYISIKTTKAIVCLKQGLIYPMIVRQIEKLST